MILPVTQSWRLPALITGRHKMNLQILKWLLKHKTVLLQVVELAKTFDKDGTYLDQWTVVDKIARLVIPVLEAEAVQPRLLALDWENDYDYSALALGAEVNALGMDYKLLLEVVIPIIIAILEALIGRKE